MAPSPKKYPPPSRKLQNEDFHAASNRITNENATIGRSFTYNDYSSPPETYDRSHSVAANYRSYDHDEFFGDSEISSKYPGGKKPYPTETYDRSHSVAANYRSFDHDEFFDDSELSSMYPGGKKPLKAIYNDDTLKNRANSAAYNDAVPPGSKTKLKPLEISKTAEKLLTQHLSPFQSPKSPNSGKTFIPSTPRSSSHPTAIFNTAPSKIIKAAKNYTSKFVNELSFTAGDFFFVVSESERYFEVIIPNMKVRGNVPKEYFLAMDKISKPITPTTPVLTSEKTSIKLPSPPKSSFQALPKDTRITKITVTSCIVPPKIFENLAAPSPRLSIRIHGINSVIEIVRSHDDFWLLQVSLLNHFPTESGRKNQPRVIPFMPVPSSNNVNTHKLQISLGKYLQMCLFLPENVLNSALFTKFLSPRAEDIVVSDHDDMDDLLDEYESLIIPNEEVKVQIVSGKHDFVLWVSNEIRLNEILDKIEHVMKRNLVGLDYMDECKFQLQVYNDNDLELLLKTREDVVFLPIFE